MPADYTIALGIKPPENPVDSISRAVSLRSLFDQRKQQRDIQAQTLADHKRAAKLAQDTQNVYAAGGNDDEVEANLRKVNAPASFQFGKDRRENKKADLAAQLEQIKLDHGKAEELGSIAGSMVDEASFHRGIGAALAKGYVPLAEAQELLAQPWGPETAARAKGWQTQALSAKDSLGQHLAELEDERKKSEHEAKLPGVKADSERKVTENEQVKKFGMTQQARETLDARNTEVAKLNTPAELAAAASDPTKTAEERAKADAALKRLNDYQKAGRPVTNVNGGVGTNVGGLTEDDYKRAGAEFAMTGTMPQLGNGGAGVKAKILHYKNEYARENNLGPRDMALAQASFAGDKKSLGKFQEQRDAIVSFEQTAQKNLDLFLGAAAKIPDTGVPWMNTPLRLLDEKLVGSANITAVNAARQVANNEIAKVTSGGGMGGVLSDSARHEVEAYNPKSATLAQTLAVAKVLKQDMANRHKSMDDMLSEIRGRVGSGGNSGGAPKATHRFNPATGKIEEIK